MLNVKDDAAAGTRRVEAPVGSNVIVRSSAGAGVTVETEGALETPKPGQPAARNGAKPAAPAAAGDGEKRWALHGDGRLILRRYGSVLAAYDIVSIPDRPPVITLVGEPQPNVRGSLTLRYKIDDDYGVTSAEADFSKPMVDGKPVTGRTLVGPPKMPLALPSGRGGLGEAETTTDLAESPWAGAQVTMVLSAKDEGGNQGLSDPVELTLPQRPFTKPLARALVEQRRNLVLAPDDHHRVDTAIDALMIAPDEFGTDAAIYLGLNSILVRLTGAKSDPDLVDAADLMWEMAVRIEDGDLADAEHDLRALQQQLRDALARGASDEEIRKLTDQLRAALDKFLNQLAQQAQRGDQQSRNQVIDRNLRTITPQDLKSLLDRLDQMARNGDLADAQRMLDQLQSILENLQTARRGGQMDQMSREMNRSLDELDRMTREQQDLRDRTYRPGQGEQRQVCSSSRATKVDQNRRNNDQKAGQRAGAAATPAEFASASRPARAADEAIRHEAATGPRRRRTGHEGSRERSRPGRAGPRRRRRRAGPRPRRPAPRRPAARPADATDGNGAGPSRRSRRPRRCDAARRRQSEFRPARTRGARQDL